MYDNDPLWKLRHALAGLGLALLLSVLAAALLGRVLGDAISEQTGGDYGSRVTVYGLLLLYVVAGAVVLFVKVARHETRPVGAGRVLRWFVSLWLWPALLAASRAAARKEPPT